MTHGKTMGKPWENHGKPMEQLHDIAIFCFMGEWWNRIMNYDCLCSLSIATGSALFLEPK
jgi:hypothetical protein